MFADTELTSMEPKKKQYGIQKKLVHMNQTQEPINFTQQNKPNKAENNQKEVLSQKSMEENPQ